MKLQKARDSYDYYSGTLSGLVRQLSFAGIAVVWMLRSESTNALFDRRMVCPLWFLVFALGMDLLHYAYASIAWGRFAYLKGDKEGMKDEAEVDAPDWINWPSNFFFWGKTLLCAIAYLILLVCLWSKV